MKEVCEWKHRNGNLGSHWANIECRGYHLNPLPKIPSDVLLNKDNPSVSEWYPKCPFCKGTPVLVFPNN